MIQKMGTQSHRFAEFLLYSNAITNYFINQIGTPVIRSDGKIMGEFLTVQITLKYFNRKFCWNSLAAGASEAFGSDGILGY